MKRLSLFLIAIALPAAVYAADAPPGQVHLDSTNVLRGRFVEERLMQGLTAPLQSSGHFTLAPGHGLLWSIEKPITTTTIVTPNGVGQDLGGMAIKLPAKNLRHLYDMVGGALAGDWNGLAADFNIAHSGDSSHWQVLLTPRPDGNAKLSYATITVSGGRFVENIVMTKADGAYESFAFSDAVLSQAPPSPTEMATFGEIK